MSSFTKAARNLHCAQSTVTAQIKGLERGLGVLLFHRRGRCPIQLTPAGVLLQEHAALILDAIDRADRDVRLTALQRAAPRWCGSLPRAQQPTATVTPRRDPRC